MPKDGPHPTDTHVEKRVRMRRMMLGLSQTKLGEIKPRTLMRQVRAFLRGGAMSDLTNDELKQNMAILETFVTTALGIIIAMSGPDPGKKKAVKTLDIIREASKRRLIEISSDMPIGEQYLDYLLSGLSENLWNGSLHRTRV